MKIKIEEEIYEGAPAEIMEQLWERSFDYELFSDLDKYMDYLGETFERVTEQPCDTLVGTTDERAPVSYTHLDVYKRQYRYRRREHRSDLRTRRKN